MVMNGVNVYKRLVDVVLCGELLLVVFLVRGEEGFDVVI